MIIWLKACPRCETGTVMVDRDVYGWNILCLQCGYMKDLRDPSEAKAFLGLNHDDDNHDKRLIAKSA